MSYSRIVQKAQESLDHYKKSTDPVYLALFFGMAYAMMAYHELTYEQPIHLWERPYKRQDYEAVDRMLQELFIQRHKLNNSLRDRLDQLDKELDEQRTMLYIHSED